MSRNTGTLLVFLAGAAVGATLGILYAPDKGKNTRDILSYQLGKYRDQLRQYISELIQEGNEFPTEAKYEGERVINDAREKAEKLLLDVETLMGQLKNQTR
ncbi:YtxH domain-containing protein [Cytophagaceae bacterium DM2B3-1]|uniref:YtxH domain-containing protein n=2 Tax=Xanthocytophaga TaxID=3078918 RepID=A0AAE3QIY2_9BACT|nr:MULTISPECIES: YtxH domain-containing protein [Xanthocytophaga]MDJ1468727.1 YtxH domain-containing protein [Xanthocytophaga flavus]MDJ1480177.1 YtxH domain-containing protein [Xanthocytophaga flavus]MDJ1495587.1 YtxH domain-containing protein [Xanthocytophaga flavus]MDJ1503981.1 YtxH domain-containing protein [Xanthocytophaga agilis]